jgi:hypothetical protein
VRNRCTIEGFSGTERHPRRSEALTRVFTGSTDSAWSITESLPYTLLKLTLGGINLGKGGLEGARVDSDEPHLVGGRFRV